MANNKKTAFQVAIENTPEVKAGYCSGLKAVKGSDRAKIVPSQPLLINGSLDIDTCVKNIYPDNNRWDYAISYNNKITFLEIHPAYDKEIKVLQEKLGWLKTWLKSNAPQIAALPKSDKPFCWMPSGETGFLSTSVSRKKIALLGISFESRLTLK